MNKAGLPYLLKVFSTIMKKMSSREALDGACEIILLSIEKKTLGHVKSHIIDQLSLIIIGKISLLVSLQIQLGPHTLALLKFFKRNKLVNEVFQDFVSMLTRSKLYPLSSSKVKRDSLLRGDQAKELMGQKEENQCISFPSLKDQPTLIHRPPEQLGLERLLSFHELALVKVLVILFELNLAAENYFKKKFGYSLLDLQGNVIWADKRSCTIFDLKKANFEGQEARVINLFEMMIPFSRNYLEAKLSEQLFSETAQLGESASFSYVIYSRVTMERCRNLFVRLQTSEKQRKKPQKPMDNFTKYLKSVSSRATLVQLSFSPGELDALRDSETCQFEISQILVQRLKESCAPHTEIPRNSGLFVFLESRLSSIKPRFNYSHLDQDKKIREFSEEIKKRVQKKKRSRSSKRKKKMPSSNKANTPEPTPEPSNSQMSLSKGKALLKPKTFRKGPFPTSPLEENSRTQFFSRRGETPETQANREMAIKREPFAAQIMQRDAFVNPRNPGLDAHGGRKRTAGPNLHSRQNNGSFFVEENFRLGKREEPNYFAGPMQRHLPTKNNFWKHSNN